MITDSLEDTVHYASLLDTARLIKSQELSPVDLTHWMLDRIAPVDGRLRSYATVTAERALAAAQDAAQEIARGRYRGPLHGMPIAVKDLCRRCLVAGPAGLRRRSQGDQPRARTDGLEERPCSDRCPHVGPC